MRLSVLIAIGLTTACASSPEARDVEPGSGKADGAATHVRRGPQGNEIWLHGSPMQATFANSTETVAVTKLDGRLYFANIVNAVAFSDAQVAELAARVARAPQLVEGFEDEGLIVLKSMWLADAATRIDMTVGQLDYEDDEMVALIANTKQDSDDGYDEAVPAGVTTAECKAHLDVGGTLTSEDEVLLVETRFTRVVPNGERSTAR